MANMRFYLPVGVENTFPDQSGKQGYILSTDGGVPEWIPLPIELPEQAGQTGKYLVTDGNIPSWQELPIMLPDQTGKAGRVLKTDGQNATWEQIANELPEITGQNGKILKTDGEQVFWDNTSEIPQIGPGTKDNFLTNDGTQLAWAKFNTVPNPEKTDAGKVLTVDVGGGTYSWKTPTGGDGTNATKYNVLDYGLVGDGITDDSPALNVLAEALDTGDVIYFPSGYTFHFYTPLSFTKAFTLLGYGAKFIVGLGDTSERISISLTSAGTFTIQGIEIDLTNSGGIALFGTGSQISPLLSLSVIDCSIKNGLWIDSYFNVDVFLLQRCVISNSTITSTLGDEVSCDSITITQSTFKEVILRLDSFSSKTIVDSTILNKVNFGNPIGTLVVTNCNLQGNFVCTINNSTEFKNNFAVPTDDTCYRYDLGVDTYGEYNGAVSITIDLGKYKKFRIVNVGSGSPVYTCTIPKLGYPENRSTNNEIVVYNASNLPYTLNVISEIVTSVLALGSVTPYRTFDKYDISDFVGDVKVIKYSFS